MLPSLGLGIPHVPYLLALQVPLELVALPRLHAGVGKQVCARMQAVERPADGRTCRQASCRTVQNEAMDSEAICRQ